jgi:3-hydroxyacyl-CoA dehydrogenase
MVHITPVILNDDQFEAFLNTVLRKTVNGLRSAGGDKRAEREVIDTYITECLGVSMSPLEIHDYFSISTPGIVGEVASSQEKQDALNALFEQRMQALIEGFG